MIDIENYVVDQVKTHLATAYPSAFVGSDITIAPPKFPYVNVEVGDNSIDTSRRTAHIENMANILLTVEVYSNLVNGRKSQAKEIAALVNDKLTELGFTRISMLPLPYEPGFYRINARYTARVDQRFTPQLVDGETVTVEHNVIYQSL